MLITATIAGRKRIDIVFLLLVVFLSISSLGYLRHRSKLHSIKKRLFSIIFENKSASPKEIAKKEYIDKGCVLVANSDEYDRFMSKAVIFLIAHGDRGSQGLIVNKPSAFTMGESAPNSGVFESNSLFMGGQDGSDMAIMIHKYDLPELSKYVGGGIFIGGMRAAKDLVEDFKATPKDFKFIFNTCQWGPGVLQKEIEMGRWGVCEVPAELILSQDSRIYNKLWSDTFLLEFSTEA